MGTNQGTESKGLVLGVFLLEIFARIGLTTSGTISSFKGSSFVLQYLGHFI